MPIILDVPTQPRAIGDVHLSSKAVGGRSVIDGLYQKGAARVVFPRSDRGLTGVLLNTSGGVTGGDQFTYAATAGPETHLTLTTQACERAYRAQPGETGCVSTTLSVAAGASLWWLPQETLLFDGCALRRRLDCEVAQDGRALIVEPVCIGRIAMGETQVTGQMRDRVRITRRGAPLVSDAWHLLGNMTEQMNRAAAGGGATSMVSLTYVADDAPRFLAPLRALLPDSGGASLLADDVLVLRLLARTGYALRTHLMPILDHVTGGHLPLCWRL